MRVLLADAIDAATVDELTALGHECVSEPKLWRTTCPAGSRASGPRRAEHGGDGRGDRGGDALEPIVRAGAGTNTIDVEAPGWAST